MSAGRRRKKGGQRSRKPPIGPSSSRPATTRRRSITSIDRGAAIAALVSTGLLFGLMLIGLWVGDAVYAALPFGPFRQTRIVSAIATLLALGAGVGLIYLIAFLVRRWRR